MTCHSERSGLGASAQVPASKVSSPQTMGAPGAYRTWDPRYERASSPGSELTTIIPGCLRARPEQSRRVSIWKIKQAVAAQRISLLKNPVPL